MAAPAHLSRYSDSRDTRLRLRLSAHVADLILIANEMRIHSAGTPADLECALDDVALFNEAMIDVFGAFGNALDADMPGMRARLRELFETAFEEPLKARLAEWEREAHSQPSRGRREW